MEEAQVEALKVARLEVRNETLEEYHDLMAPPVSLPVRGRFAVIQDRVGGGLDAELVAFEPGLGPVHYFRDGRSLSGWGKQEITLDGMPGEEAQRIAAYYEERQAVAIFQFPPSSSPRVLAAQRDAGGAWQPLRFDAEIEGLLERAYALEVFQDHDGRHYLVGTAGSKDGSSAELFLISRQASVWSVAFRKTDRQQVDPRLWAIRGRGDAKLTLVRTQRSDAGGHDLFVTSGTVVDGKFVPVHDEVQVYTAINDAVGAIVALPGVAGADGRLSDSLDFLFLGANSELFYVFKGDRASPRVKRLNPEQVGPRQILDLAAGLTAGKIRIFATHTSTRQLWLLREQSTAPGGERLFGNWSHLGDVVEGLSVPIEAATGAEMFFVDGERRLYHAVEAADSSWRDHLLAVPRPTSEITRSTAHCLHVTALSAQGAPVPFARVVARASWTSSVRANGSSVHLGPRAEVPLSADATGQLVLKMDAVDLVAPTIELHAPDFMKPGAFQPYSLDAVLHRRLAGSDPQFPITAESLKKNGVLPDTVAPDKAAEIADLVRKVGTEMAKKSKGDPTSWVPSPPETSAWEFDFTGPEGFTIQALTPEQAEARIALLVRREPAAEVAGIFAWFGDLVRHIGRLVEKVKKIVVTVVEGAIQFAIDLIEGAKTFILETASAIGQALTSLLHAVAYAVGKIVDAARAVLDWLRKQFGWDEILRVKEVVKLTVNRFLDTVVTGLDGPAIGIVRREFEKQRSSIEQSFTAAKKELAERSLRVIAGEQTAGRNPYDDPSYAEMMRSHGVQMDFAFQHARAHLDRISPTTVESGPDVLDDLVARLRKVAEKQGRPEAVEELVQHVWSLKDPAKLLTDGLGLLLDLIQKAIGIVLEATTELIVVTLEVVAATVAALKKFLSYKIEVPFLVSLWRFVSGDPNADLTLLELGSLLVALPATIAHRVVRGQVLASEADLEAVRKFSPPWQRLTDVVKPPARPRHLSASVQREVSQVVAIFERIGGWALYVGRILTTVLAIVADGNQIISNDPGRGVAALKAIAEVAAQALRFPLRLTCHLFSSGCARFSVAQAFLYIGFWLGALKALLDLVLASSGKLLQLIGKAGPVLTSISGMVLSLVELVAAVMFAGDKRTADCLRAVSRLTANLNLSLKFLLYVRHPVANGIVLGGDLILGAGAIAVRYVSLQVPQAHGTAAEVA